MRINYISVDEQNYQYKVGLINGECFTGRNAVWKIELRKNHFTGKIEPIINGRDRRELRLQKKEEELKKLNNRKYRK